MTIPSSRFLIFEVKSTGSELAFGRLRTSSEDFGRLRKTSDLFRNLRKWSCRLQKSHHSQDKNLTLISQKKLASIYNMCHVILYNIRHVMLYNICHVMLFDICSEQNRTCYITCVMLYNICHVLLYNICHVMLYIYISCYI